jgi:tetratricopeptide (TPR) repeat protein
VATPAGSRALWRIPDSRAAGDRSPRGDLHVSPDRERRRRLILEAEGYLELGMPQHALRAIARICEPDELDGHAAFLKGDALRSLERYGEAVVALERAVETSADNIHVWLALGWCHKRTGRIDLAIASLEEALSVEPDEAIVHYNLACYWSLAGDVDQSLDCLARAFEIDPHYRGLVDSEPDFDPIRTNPRFVDLTTVIV